MLRALVFAAAVRAGVDYAACEYRVSTFVFGVYRPPGVCLQDAIPRSTLMEPDELFTLTLEALR